MFETFAIILLLLVELMLFGAMLIVLSLGWQALFGVPWARTPRNLSKEMLELAGVKKGDHVLDLGSGDGSVVLEAVRGFEATGTGVEKRRDLTMLSRLRGRKYKDRAQFVRGDFFQDTLPDADVITAYIFPGVNERLVPVLRERYPKGTPLVSRSFTFPGLELVKQKKIGKEVLYLYRIS